MLHDSESWLTYAEAGELLGISAEAVRQKARRHKWPRRTPNTYGSLALVQVPLNAVHPAVDAVQDRPRTASYGVQNGVNGVQSDPERGTADSRDRPYDQPDILVHFEQTLDALRQLLGIANRRADDDRARADKAEQELAALRAELVELRISQQAASDIASMQPERLVISASGSTHPISAPVARKRASMKSGPAPSSPRSG